MLKNAVIKRFLRGGMGIVGQAVRPKYKFVSIMIKRFVTPYKARQVAGFDPFFVKFY